MNAKLDAETVEDRMLPATLVEGIYSHGMAEDGRTLCVMCDMVDGSTVMISVCPGRPIAACVVEEARR